MRRPRPARPRPARRLVAALAGISLAAACSAGPSEAETPRATIRDATVELEVVRTRSEQALGLGDRDSLPWGRGMLFPYERPHFATFWMKRMRFDIDIVWIRESRIVGIAHFVPHPREEGERPVTVRSPELIDQVLEVPAGFARAHGWKRGDRVSLEGL